jgi:hypothetical protein
MAHTDGKCNDVYVGIVASHRDQSKTLPYAHHTEFFYDESFDLHH